MTSLIYSNPANQSTLNTSLTVTLPGNNALPYGWYMTWVGASDVYSNGLFVQIGPPSPPPPRRAGRNEPGRLLDHLELAPSPRGRL